MRLQLRARRRHRGKTQAACAKAAGVSVHTWSAWERGLHTPSLSDDELLRAVEEAELDEEKAPRVLRQSRTARKTSWLSGQEIRRLREEAGLTMARCALGVGVATSTWSRWESGGQRSFRDSEIRHAISDPGPRLSGQEIQRLREKAGLTSYACACAAGVTPPTWSAWERGEGLIPSEAVIVAAITVAQKGGR